jgi:DNA-binding LacI/PurR family transcriptional regulator
MAEENNIKIPRDLSVVGFDDLTYSSLMSVPLTTVRQPSYAIGEETCKMVLGMIENKTLSAEDVYFNPELIVRKSTRKLNI